MGFAMLKSPTRASPEDLTRQGSSMFNNRRTTMEEMIQNPLTSHHQQHLHHLLGKQQPPSSSMILDDYLKTLTTKTGNNFTQKKNAIRDNASSSASSSSSSSSSCSSVLSPQSSCSVNLNRTQSHKALEQVWKDVFPRGNGQETTMQMTLEELLVQTGTINQPVGSVQGFQVNYRQLDSVVVQSAQQQQQHQQPEWVPFQMAVVQPQVPQMGVLMPCLPDHGSMFGNAVADVGFSESGLSMPMNMPMGGGVTERKRKVPDEVLEKTIERRQKRMIKNRESAARSRAKKQAYNNKLEHEASQLQIMNHILQNEKDIFLRLDPNPQPKYQLRRTSSAPY